MTAIVIEPQTTENGVITQNARLQVYTPKPHFGGGSVKWYEDKPKLTKKTK